MLTQQHPEVQNVRKNNHCKTEFDLRSLQAANPAGTKCRVIKDDFMPGIFYFEHIKCPSAPAVAVDHKTLPPINKKEIAFA